MSEPFGSRLRHLRSAHGYSLGKLGLRVSYSRQYIWDLETGRRMPTPATAARLDAALDAGGELAALAQPTPAPDAAGLPPWGDRVMAGVTGQARPDPAMLDYLTQSLALQRSAEDTAGAGVVLPMALAQASTVTALRTAAGGELHDQLLSLEAQSAQFAGWLHQDLGNTAASEQWYARAISQGHELGDENMIASILSMRSNAAWSARDARRSVALGEAACRPNATPGVLALSHQQLARGYALTGQRAEMLRALDRAEELVDLAGRSRDGEPPWTYFQGPVRLQIQRAMALRDLGDYPAAVTLFEAALADLPTTYRRDRGVYLARLALTHALAGERDGALEVAGQAQIIAGDTGSARLAGELNRVDRLLK